MIFTIPRDYGRYSSIEVYRSTEAGTCGECPVYEYPPHTYKTWVSYLDGSIEQDYPVCRMHAREWRRFRFEQYGYVFWERQAS